MRRLALLSRGPLEQLIAVGDDVTDHFRRRARPAFFFDPARWKETLDSVSRRERERCIAAAEGFSSLSFTFRGRPPVRFSGAVDWRCMEDKDPDWNGDLHRLDWILTLILAGHLSGNAGFVKGAAHWMCSWEQSNGPGTRPWSDPFEVAQRSHTLCWILFTGLHHPAFTREAIEAALRALLGSGIWIEGTLEYKTPNNHLLIESLRLAQLGLLFPEFPLAARWLGKGMRLLEREVTRQVSSDGVHREHSVFYQRMIAEALLELLLLCRRNDARMAESFVGRLQRMLHFLGAIARPDGTFPLIGDGFDSDILLRCDLLHASKSLWGRPRSVVGGGSLYTTLLMGSSHEGVLEEGLLRPPLEVWREGGYATLRSGSPPDESTLLLDFGPFGMDAAPGHGHADCLSLDLSVRGRPVLVDPGSGSWRQAPRWRGHFRGTRAHNTVTVDGVDQTPLHGYFGAGPFARPTLHGAWASRHLHCIDASHAGYQRLPFPVTHRRVVLETGRDGWLVLDLLEGAGSHAVEAAWHFDPRLSAHLADGAAFLRDGDQAEVRMIWKGSASLDGAVYRGSREPFMGWVSRECGRLEAAWVLVVSGKAILPLGLATALLPWAPGREPPELRVAADGDGFRAFLETESSLTSTFAAWSGREGGHFGSWQTDGSFAAAREGVDPDALGCERRRP
jgi:uncharacterized heparinase superfamily protein